ncbi:MAG: Flp pilus assembly complex ATPase component TadA [Tenericutes bacterium]|nr:Flp pilus assembly complex ATPase component TadA [Mycoplasmatota bacterium]
MALKRIGDILIKENLLTQKQLVKALENKNPDEKLGETFIRLKMLNEMQILKALETSTGVKRVSLNTYNFDSKALKMVSEDFCRRNNIIPLKFEGRKLLFATSDPLNFSAIEEIRMATGYQPQPFSSPRDDIFSQIEKHYGFKETLEALGVDTMIQEEIIDADEETPMVRLVNQILSSAVFQRASDIHIDPLDKNTIIRYRVDGVLDIVRELPSNIHKQMINRIKIMADMDITDTRVPQDGRIQTNIQDRKLDLRISTLPTVRGEKVVMRILDLTGSMNKLEYLGLSPHEEKLINNLISKPNGILLVSGPTGSGKTTTLYAFLNELNNPSVNIVTVEDPVEIKMQGVNQVQVHSEIDLTFANALRSILRQDPNIIMIGEIRDKETAEISIRAALTGHLVLSTIHTNSASKTVTRLLDMDIEPFLIASSLSGVISQRLVRRICPECNIEEELSSHEKEIFDKYGIDSNFKTKRAKGCPSCNFKGYAGRMGLFEILPISKEIENLISKNASVHDIDKVAIKQGLKPLIVSGLEAVKRGETTLEEVLKVAED